ncbi:hypothetical protein ACX40Y_01150 [Sphingomonas sp. RS6]
MSKVERAIAIPVRRFVATPQLILGLSIAVAGLSTLAGKMLGLA